MQVQLITDFDARAVELLQRMRETITDVKESQAYDDADDADNNNNGVAPGFV